MPSKEQIQDILGMGLVFVIIIVAGVTLANKAIQGGKANNKNFTNVYNQAASAASADADISITLETIPAPTE